MMGLKASSFWRKFMSGAMACVFAVTSMGLSSAQGMPTPGQMVALSPVFQPPLLKGIKVYGNDPFRFDFILDNGDGVENVSARLIKYFLAALTVPEKDLWVNLSPYEKDRIVPDGFGQTEMGRDLLAQDYILKQITASLIYPENETGKAFWAKVYKAAFEKYGTTDIPVDTFNKVWIVPNKANVYENGTNAFIVDATLKVMLETDYEAMVQNTLPARGHIPQNVSPRTSPANEPLNMKAFQGSPVSDTTITKNILREIVIPILEKEVNEGKNFVSLRQVYYSLILATWYKRKVKDSVMSRAYVDQNKLSGVDIEDKAEKEKIWAKYVEAFSKGAFDLIKEEKDLYTQEMVPRKYFSGGMGFAGNISSAVAVTTDAVALPQDASLDHAQIIRMKADMAETLDQRPVTFGLLKAPFVGYAMAVKEVINPDDRDLVAVYGGSGADISSFLLSTNATRAYFVDIADVDAGYLQSILDKWDRLEVTSYGPGYLDTKQEVGFGDSEYNYRSTFAMQGIEHKLLLELKGLGVDKESLRITHDDQGLATIEFEWAYSGRAKQTYKVSFIQADLTSPEHYPSALTTALGRGIDIYYQRAGLFLPIYYGDFLKHFSDALRPGGFLVTDDNKLSSGGFGEIDPDGMLMGFSPKGELISDGMRRYGAQILDTFKDIGIDPARDAYGWEVNIRQKKPDADKAQTIDVADYYSQGGWALAEALESSLDKKEKVFLREDGVDLEVVEQWEAGVGTSIFLCQDAGGKKVIVKILNEYFEKMGILEKQSLVLFFDVLGVDEKARSLFAWFEGGASRFAALYRLNMFRMEYVEGKSLFQVAGLKERLPLLVKLIEGLAYVHRQYKTFHGDLHDANIRVTPDGQLKLIDWDQLRVLVTGDDIRQIKFGMKYKDIFSMGRLLLNSYGRSEVSSSGWKDMFQPLDISRRVPTEIKGAENVPAGMLKIINKAMLVDPTEHYESLDEMLADLRQELTAEGFADMAQSELQETFLSSPLNDPAWLGSLKVAVEKEFNQNRPLRSLKPVVQSVWQGPSKNWKGLIEQLKDVPDDEYVYVPFIRASLTGAVINEFFIVKAGAARKQIGVRHIFSGMALPGNEDILFASQTTVESKAGQRTIILDMLTLLPSLQDRKFASEFFPRYVEFLSTNFSGEEIRAEIRNPRTQVFFDRYFRGAGGLARYGVKEMALDLFVGVFLGFSGEKDKGVVPRNFRAPVDHAETVDQRPVEAGLLREPFVGYAMGVKDVVNPDGKDIIAVYGGSGADISSFLLSTDASKAYFVDIAKVDGQKLEEQMKKWDLFGRKAVGDDYLDDKSWRGYGQSTADWNGARPMVQIERRLLVELKAMGVDRDSVRIETGEDGLVTLSFRWAYSGRTEKRYVIKFIEANVAFYKEYPQALKDVVEHGFDIYYQRAGFFLPRQYDHFLPYLALHLKPGGFLVTDDMAGDEEHRGEVAPDGLLAQFMPGEFTAKGELVSDGMKFWEGSASFLKSGKKASEANQAYGWKTNIRQKKEGAFPAVRDAAQSGKVPPHFLFKSSDGVDDKEMEWFARFKIADPDAVEHYADLLAETIRRKFGDDLRQKPRRYCITEAHARGLRTAASYLTKKVAEKIGVEIVDLDTEMPPQKAGVVYSRVETLEERTDLVKGSTRLRVAGSVAGREVISLDDTFVTGAMSGEVVRALEKEKPSGIHLFFMFWIDAGEQEYQFGQKGLNGEFPAAMKRLLSRADFGITKGFLHRLWEIPEYQVEDLVSAISDDARATIYLYALQYGKAMWVDSIVHLMKHKAGLSLPSLSRWGFSAEESPARFQPVIELTRDENHRIAMASLEKILPWMEKIVDIYQDRSEAKLVLFDLDKTLNHAQSYYRVVKELSRRIIAQESGVDVDTVSEKVIQLRQALGAKGYPLRGHDLPEAFGIDPQRYDLEVARVVKAGDYIREDPALIKSLENLKRRGKKLAVLTDSGVFQAQAILEAMGVRGLFDRVIASGDAGYRKPDERLFTMALNEFGVTPAEAIMVGDNQAMDLEPAWSLGMRAVKISRKKDIDQIEHALAGVEFSEQRVDKAQGWERFIIGGLVEAPAWSSSRLYQEFDTNELMGTTQMSDMFIKFFLQILHRENIVIPSRARGLALGIGYETKELLMLDAAFDLSLIHGVEWNGPRLERVARGLSAMGLSPDKFMLHHADMNDLHMQIPDGSVDLIYGTGLAVDLDHDGMDLKASLAQEIVRMLSPGGVLLMVSQGENLIPVLEKAGKVKNYHNYIVFQKDPVVDAAHRVEKGGIDLDPTNMDLQVKANGDGLHFDIDPVRVEQLKAAFGLTPVILGIQPLNGLRRFLGVL